VESVGAASLKHQQWRGII